jgi:hypothetical protein
MKEGSLFILFVSHVDEIFEIKVSLAMLLVLLENP